MNCLIVILGLVGGFLLAREAKSPYRYFLDPERAEEALAKLSTRRRLFDDEWLEILGDRKNRTYTVRKGDNLWTISKQQMKDPFLWRKLWQVNPVLTNPHEVSVGQILSYYRETGDTRIKIPLIKLVPSNGVTDLDKDSFINPQLKAKFLPDMVVFTEGDFVGEITGAYTAKTNLYLHDEIYVLLYEKQKASKFSIVRIERELNVPTDTFGEQFIFGRLIGEIEVIHKGEELWSAELKSIFHPIERGDRLIPLQKPVSLTELKKTPEDLSATVLRGRELPRHHFGQGDLVLLDRGSEQGMKTGYRFRVLRSEDPNLKSEEVVEPSFKGEIQVVSVSQEVSIGFVTKVQDVIQIGDTLLPYQSFKDPRPRSRREAVSLEID